MINFWRILLLGGFMLVALPSQATHEVDHRYKIFGQVLDDKGEPVANEKVRLTGLGGRPLGETTTSKTGRYEFPLHVHNQQLGTKFWVSVNGRTKGDEITFEPSDIVTERTHRIDFPSGDS